MPGNKVIPSFPGWVSSNFILWETGAIALEHPRTQRLRSLCPAVGNERPPWKDAILGAYHLAKKSGNFRWKSNGTVIFRKIPPRIVDYLQRSSFSVRNGTSEISLPITSFLSSSLSLMENKTGNRISNGKRQLVRLVCWFWKIPYHYQELLPLFNVHPNRFLPTNGKHRKYGTSYMASSATS